VREGEGCGSGREGQPEGEDQDAGWGGELAHRDHSLSRPYADVLIMAVARRAKRAIRHFEGLAAVGRPVPAGQFEEDIPDDDQCDT
jgi:hypothetical protein